MSFIPFRDATCGHPAVDAPRALEPGYCFDLTTAGAGGEVWSLQLTTAPRCPNSGVPVLLASPRPGCPFAQHPAAAGGGCGFTQAHPPSRRRSGSGSGSGSEGGPSTGTGAAGGQQSGGGGGGQGGNTGSSSSTSEGDVDVVAIYDDRCVTLTSPSQAHEEEQVVGLAPVEADAGQQQGFASVLFACPPPPAQGGPVPMADDAALTAGASRARGAPFPFAWWGGRGGRGRGGGGGGDVPDTSLLLST
ncbi:hypothetical protein GGR56DRAFT_693182 [Xylariaceae sp. FL0804]|nr:hypothetical protein GGR56DRAFT_693182 [Xylariaceae sp. FL0804]